MATFLEARINEQVTADTTFEVEHPARIKVYGVGGQLEQVWGDVPPRHRVDLAHGIKTQAQFQSIVDAFYVVMFTPYTGLRVKNWQDYQATQANSKLTEHAGSPGEWQLQRKHVFGGITFLRDIVKPCASPVPEIYRTRAAVVTLASSAVDSTTGIATISGHVAGDTYTWVGEFDLPMTFTDNRWRAKLEGSVGNLWVVNEPIVMEEVLLP